MLILKTKKIKINYKNNKEKPLPNVVCITYIHTYVYVCLYIKIELYNIFT